MLTMVPSNRGFLFLYFIFIIVLGSILLFLPASWSGPDRLPYVDALFTSTSAVCVTGLITVDTALYSPFGQTVIMVLIQAGGLGIITFSTLYLTSSGRKISFTNRKIIKDYFIDTIEFDPRKIIRNILILTFTAEAAGFLLLFAGFRGQGVERAAFASLFHAVSAFCNAGFSTFSDSMESFTSSEGILTVIMLLIILGGIGFVVVQDISKKMRKRKRLLSMHSRIVLTVTLVLILFGALVFGLFEWDRSMSELRPGEKVVSSVFQSVTPRTAGFNTITQSRMSLPSRVFTIVLMFIGGSPGSIAGGIKITTFFIILLVALKGTDRAGYIRISRHRIPQRTINNALSFFLKALLVVFVFIFVFVAAESFFNAKQFTFLEMVFESFSAFGTVGLSLGITSSLSAAGKFIIIATMFCGRVVILSLAMPHEERDEKQYIDFPDGEVLIG